MNPKTRVAGEKCPRFSEGGDCFARNIAGSLDLVRNIFLGLQGRPSGLLQVWNLVEVRQYGGAFLLFPDAGGVITSPPLYKINEGYTQKRSFTRDSRVTYIALSRAGVICFQYRASGEVGFFRFRDLLDTSIITPLLDGAIQIAREERY